ncbi:M91 family zinc metallopeptidase [Catellatospora sp. KI3]|uniref:M91 family zinc metallopeptidase n=1 Tax=Catellatospora sp. KI3 TaxID=3041620 RepID=UPI002482880D|nr:M91 family zinc metallopeptidase [Catellatospora sp. KI3]MDI1463501.1 M91 family zinc metallopeptidase [Catellatospora sp. KI3]
MGVPPEDQEYFPPITAAESTWQLHANPGRISSAASAWRRFGKSATTLGDDLETDAKNLVGSQWSGPARDSYVAHKTKLVSSVDALQANADKLAGHLDGVAGLLQRYQGALDAEYAKVRFRDVGGTFHPRSEQEQKLIIGAIAEAGTLRSELEQALAQQLSGFDHAGWNSIAVDWGTVVAGTTDPFTLPPEATDGVSVIMVDGRAVVNTGTGDNNVKVRIDPRTGDVIITVDGADHYYPPGTPVTIRGGEGNDTIEVPKGSNISVTLLGGAGNDTIRGGDGSEKIFGGHGTDDLYGGRGDDYVSGGSGIDYIDGQDGNDVLSGGSGQDTLYGLGGDDQMSGGEDDDYLEGAKGNDTVYGGAGKDVLSGGQGDDRLAGGTGDDVYYGGHGKDSIIAGGGADTAYRQDEDTVDGVTSDVKVEISDKAQFIKIEGSDEFKERVLADLDMYRASPTGQQMLENLEDKRDPNFWLGENTLTIKELTDENGYANKGHKLANSDSVIQYNPGFTFDSERGRPSVVLYHELGHVYDYWNDTFQDETITGGPDDGIRKGERQAAGLPFDHDGDPATPDQLDPDHPIQYTENGLRKEMGMQERDTYATYPGDGW